MATYETFAAVYDSIMDDSLYEKWTAFSQRHFPKGKKKLLELACGTGIQSLRFAQAGYAVTGLDLSREMLAVAQKRAAAAGQAIDFVEGDMRDLSQLGSGSFELVTCYSDSLCYMEDEAAVGDVFQQVYDCLEEGGVFIFDVHSTYQMETVFSGYSYHENAEQFAFVWDTYPDEPPYSVVHELTFFIADGDGRFTRFDEVHEERTYELLTYDVLLDQAGFQQVQVFADFEDQLPAADSQRWFFVCRK